MKRNTLSLAVYSLVLVVGMFAASCIAFEKQLFGPGAVTTKKGGIIINADIQAGSAAEDYQKEYKKNNYSVYFDKELLKKLIEESGAECKGFRVYRTVNNNETVDDKGVIGMIIVPVDSNGKDITSETKKIGIANSLVSYDICPNNCDRESVFCID